MMSIKDYLEHADQIEAIRSKGAVCAAEQKN